MGHLSPAKLQVQFAASSLPAGPFIPRRYALTRSDVMGDLLLTVAPEVNREQNTGWYTTLMRGGVIDEYKGDEDGPALHVFYHVSGGLVVGSAAMRNTIFQRELPLVLEAFRTGDEELYERRLELHRAPILVLF